ncbi:MAG: glycosyltransferase family 39 protein [Clostridia bacterium]|nr:glycosyltransferase family 39 protein [Clostridia bacterium]
MSTQTIVKPKQHSPLLSRKLPVWYTRAVMAFCLLFFGYIALFSLCQVSVFDPENFAGETVLYQNNAPLGILLLLTLGFGAAWLLRRYIRRPIAIPLGWLIAGLTVYVMVLGLSWIYTVQSVPAADSGEIFRTAQCVIAGDWSLFYNSGNDFYGDMSYFNLYPFQLGYVFLCEGVMRLFGSDTAMPLEVLNVIALAALYAGLQMLCHRLFRRPALTLILTLLLAACLQPILFTTFVYGNLPGFAAAVWACWFLLLFTGTDKPRRFWLLIPIILLLCLSVLAKYNNLLWVVAIALYLLIDGIRRRKLHCLLTAALVAVAPLLCQQAVIRSYEHRSGASLGDGVSQLLYLEAGLNESPMAPGWYNDRGRYVFVELNGDQEAISEQARAQLDTRLKELADDPRYTLDFFRKKVLSQWNEPSYQSLWVSQVKGHYNGHPAEGSWLDNLYNGKANVRLYDWFNFYQTAVFLFFSVAMVFLLRRAPLGTAPLLTVLAGAAVYHLLFEAKSQYCLTYFILIVFFAAYGLYEIARRLPCKRP